MIESAAYELIKKEGYEEGYQQGMRQGMVESARRIIVSALEARFDLVPSPAVRALLDIEDPEMLELLHRTAHAQKNRDQWLVSLDPSRGSSSGNN